MDYMKKKEIIMKDIIQINYKICGKSNDRSYEEKRNNDYNNNCERYFIKNTLLILI
jgi:hypothetical protein